MDGLPWIFGVRPPSLACTPSSPTPSHFGASCMSFWPKSSARRRLVSPSRHLILSRLGRCVHCSCLDSFWGGRRRILGFGSLSHRRSVRIPFLFFRHLLIFYTHTSYLQSPRLRLNDDTFYELYGYPRCIPIPNLMQLITHIHDPIYLAFISIAIYDI